MGATARDARGPAAPPRRRCPRGRSRRSRPRNGSARTRTRRPTPPACAGPRRTSPQASRSAAAPPAAGARCPYSCSAANWTPGRRPSDVPERAAGRSAGDPASSSSPTRPTSSARATPNAAGSWSGVRRTAPKRWPPSTPPARRACRRSTRWASIPASLATQPPLARTRQQRPARSPAACGRGGATRRAMRSRAGRRPKTAGPRPHGGRSGGAAADVAHAARRSS